MAGESPKETTEDLLESLIDELISEIFSEPAASAESSARGASALLETAIGSMRKAPMASGLERLLLAHAFAAELADALAPALADALAPRLLKALEASMAETTGRKPASAGRSSSHSRKPETK